MPKKNFSMQILLRFFLAMPIIFIALFLNHSNAYAATHTWIGGSPLGPNWSVPANWSGGVPSNGDDLVFPANAKGDHTNINNLPGLPQFNSISFTGLFTALNSYTITGNPIVLAHGISDTASGGTQNINFTKIIFPNAIQQTFLVTNSDESVNIGAIDISGANLVLDGAGNIVVNGSITSTDENGNTSGGLITKSGTGTLTLAATINSYTGLTKITGGTLIINAEQTASHVSVTNANTLAGTGKTGEVSIDSVGTISPGNSGPGIFSTGNFNFSSGSNYNVDIKGVIAGAGYDQIFSTGSVTLNSSSLNASLGFTSKAGDSFTIVKATGIISGTFKGLPNGSTLNLENRQFKIAYNTNNVTLTDVTGAATSAPGTTTSTSKTSSSSPSPSPNPTSPTDNESATTTTNPSAPPTLTETPKTQAAEPLPLPAPALVPEGTECAGFTDVSKTDPNCDAITYVKSVGAMTGNPDGTFGLNNYMQRDQMAKIVLKIFKRFDPVADYCNDISPFPDVSPGDWAYQYICNGKKLGMITGYLSGEYLGKFRPGHAVNRAEFLALILRNLNEPMPDINSTSYLDIEPGTWYSGYAKFAFYQVLFLGQYLYPNQYPTRGEGAAVIYKLHQQNKL